jgi:hypothetical protein
MELTQDRVQRRALVLAVLDHRRVGSCENSLGGGAGRGGQTELAQALNLSVSYLVCYLAS